jgi:hypothetical protein
MRLEALRYSLSYRQRGEKPYEFRELIDDIDELCDIRFVP